MHLFYVDESGNRDPLHVTDKDWLYVLTAISLFEHRWHGFEKTLNRYKGRLAARIKADTGLRLDLADMEIKSDWIRIPKARSNRPFLSNLTPGELQGLVDVYYQQLEHHHMHIFSVVVDKRQIPEYMDSTKLQRKAWELLLAMVERFMRVNSPKHQAILVKDDVSKQENRALAMKHSYILDQGTVDALWLAHICEMPMFVRSELSNGVQLADLCSYNIYRAFVSGDLSYPFFRRIASNIWTRSVSTLHPFSGIFVLPGHSPLRDLVETFENERSRAASPAGSEEMMSGGANPIEPTSGTGQKIK